MNSTTGKKNQERQVMRYQLTLKDGTEEIIEADHAGLAEGQVGILVFSVLHQQRVLPSPKIPGPVMEMVKMLNKDEWVSVKKVDLKEKAVKVQAHE